ncbi:LSU ribosomal protein L21P [Magnetococcus marinus MC-1]|uniref:Large ribosomal subunit protein bL21 n=1 Tax=Magnetococcus marinus (strain ATCC BAA-1437 / JCM 17883 / MC-1) TaxID=156889 RepID=RL21_MAGMM|nr:50S ribosomal protein L21 [Magnetococcus marinus]A0LCZ5.1 RecName: Full=Large ribosomal subunit protein bL21; AltName: Full=50S ribosomal protein L21 [Magnetococcus marinus MC-1]ABK45838.1 LSU ribosomal protein L21P [Magnetococcus marinus MC-1]
MYAVIRTGGKQYKVSQGDVLRVETVAGDAGGEVIFDDVLMVGGDEGLKVGEATEGAKVTGTIIRQMRDKKVIVFKKKRRKNYIRTQGHRQNLTVVRISGIS